MKAVLTVILLGWALVWGVQFAKPYKRVYPETGDGLARGLSYDCSASQGRFVSAVEAARSNGDWGRLRGSLRDGEILNCSRAETGEMLRKIGITEQERARL